MSKLASTIVYFVLGSVLPRRKESRAPSMPCNLNQHLDQPVT